MDGIPFVKMSGSGNDFIIIDNRTGAFDRAKTPDFIKAVCERKVSVGADGLIVIENAETADFSWRFFNADGSEAEMCGNGARCTARFAFLKGIAPAQMSFETIAGTIRAEVDDSEVRIQLSRPQDFCMDVTLDVDGQHMRCHTINTGVPHAVFVVDDLEGVPVQTLGEKIRYHRYFQPAGTNVNFVFHANDTMIHIRTYERGVEGETFACGTGAVAAALTAIAGGMVSSPVQITTRSGEVLTVDTPDTAPPFTDVFLTGGTRLVYEGCMGEEAYAAG